MISPKTKTSAADALAVISAVTLTSFVIATLYFARDILIPLALSSLLTFLLAPMVTRVERWVGRIAAVLLVVTLIFAVTGIAGWIFTRQLIDLSTNLPEYKVNIVTKLHAFTIPEGGAFKKFSQTVEELKKELPGGDATPSPTVSQESGKPETVVVSPAPSKTAVPVQVVESSKANPIELAEALLAPLLGPFGTSALVFVLVLCMLLQREDLRNRLIRLIGQGHISTTARAMDDASQRVTRYLLMQFIVNLTYGVLVAIGLYFIGVPNALLWGAFGLALRFIPYVGPWVALILPTLLALAVSPHWTMPILTVALFAGLELLLNNVMEPMLYGRHTGISSIALIIAAVFWTWLWGAVGLVLATPLTVCLVVMGRHVPRLAFLSVLLSDEEALTPAEDCYHRLLTPGERDEMELVDTYLKTHSLTELYDSVLIPVIKAAGADAASGTLGAEHLAQLEQSVHDMIEDLGVHPAIELKIVTGETESETLPKNPSARPTPPCRVFCLPARATRDELAGAMLAQLLAQEGVEAKSASAKLVAGELLGLVEKAGSDVVCISVVAPSTVVHARYLSSKLRGKFPKLKIVIGLWGATDGMIEASKRLRDAVADEVLVSFSSAVALMVKLAPSFTEALTRAPLPADDELRLAALRNLDLLDTGDEPVFDRITAKLARIFDVPIALLTLVDRDRQYFKSKVGLPSDLLASRESPRDVSICGHVVAQNDTLVVEDLARDRRFANNPLLAQNGLRFYAGVPLRTPDGQPIGSLCLLDTKPRQFTERDRRQLQEYAREIMEEFARRAALVEAATDKAQVPLEVDRTGTSDR